LPLINKGEKLGVVWWLAYNRLLRMARCLLWDFCGKIVAIENFIVTTENTESWLLQIRRKQDTKE
jgi:hypothetical protein